MCILAHRNRSDIAILSLRYPISRDTFLREVSTPPKRCDTTPFVLTHTHIGAIPHFATYRAIIVRYPIKQARKSFAILSLQVSRDMKSIAAGPLRMCIHRGFWQMLWQLSAAANANAKSDAPRCPEASKSTK